MVSKEKNKQQHCGSDSAQRKSLMESLTKEISACKICAEHLPFPPRPVVQLRKDAKILIIAQAPGLRVQETGIPFNDSSGERLCQWLGISREIFYGKEIGIVPMGFCYPGKGKSGDLPPRRECAPL